MNYLKMITLKKMTKETKPITVQDEKIKSMITALSPLQARLVAGIAIYYESEISRLHDAELPSEWISVKDKLPEVQKNNYTVNVLAIDIDGEFIIGYFDTQNLKFVTAMDDKYYQYGITHWQPLPQLPITNQPHKI